MIYGGKQMMQVVEKLIPWKKVIAQPPVASGAYGTTYHVPELGEVWIAPSLAPETARHSGDELCALVSPQKEGTANRLWLFVGFAPQAQ
jgi:hypothetical protein